MEVLPHTLIGWVELTGIVIAGAFGLVWLFSQNLQKKREDTNKVDDRLIELLKSTVDALEKKVKELEDGHIRNSMELERLKTENTVMARILQGRDKEAVEFRKATSDSIKTVLDIVNKTNEHVERLYVLLEEHFKHI